MSKSALIVVDMQNDFCPPHGSLAVSGGREIVPTINKLLESSAFAIKVATQDYHPQDHISFASNHEAPNNKPFTSYIEVQNILGGKPHETMQQRLWPVHCVQKTPGADLVDELDTNQIDLIVQKGMDKRFEMYSVFSDTFNNSAAGTDGVSHDLAKIFHEKGITDVYVVGLAGGHCVKDSALGAARAGFSTRVIEECQRCVTPDDWEQAKQALHKGLVRVVSVESDEVKALLS